VLSFQAFVEKGLQQFIFVKKRYELSLGANGPPNGPSEPARPRPKIQGALGTTKQRKGFHKGVCRTPSSQKRLINNIPKTFVRTVVPMGNQKNNWFARTTLTGKKQGGRQGDLPKTQKKNLGTHTVFTTF